MEVKIFHLPWVSLRHDQLVPVNKAGNEKEQLEKKVCTQHKKVTSWLSPGNELLPGYHELLSAPLCVDDAEPKLVGVL
jgi:hypothetical protein